MVVVGTIYLIVGFRIGSEAAMVIETLMLGFACVIGKSMNKTTYYTHRDYWLGEAACYVLHGCDYNDYVTNYRSAKHHWFNSSANYNGHGFRLCYRKKV